MTSTSRVIERHNGTLPVIEVRGTCGDCECSLAPKSATATMMRRLVTPNVANT